MSGRDESAGLGGFPVGVVDCDETHVGLRDDVNLVEALPAADHVAGAALVPVHLEHALQHEQDTALRIIG